MTINTLIATLQSFGTLSSDGVLVFNLRTGKIEYVNQSLADFFSISYDSSDHEAEFFMTHLVEDDKEHLIKHYNILLKDRRVENVEFAIRSHNDSIRNISANAYVIKNNRYIIGFFRDITITRQHENYIINYGAKKNTLLDMVTHNLSGPLAISKSLLESLEQVVAVKQIDHNIQAHIHLVKESTRHCIDLVNDFIEEEHVVSSRISVKRNRFELFQKINTIVERFRKAYPDFTFTVTSTVPALNVSLDDVKFLQVMNNLISNAIKWSPAKSEVEIHVEENAEQFFVSVIDNGAGIPEHLHPFVFDKNSRAGRKGLRGEKSIGLGLYISKKLVTLMDGTITFESREGEGSSFTLKFQKNDVAEDSNSSHQHQHQ